MTRNSINLLAVVGLSLTPLSSAAQNTSPLFTQHFTKEEFAQRRARICETIGPEAAALVQGAGAVHSSARFRQSNQFFYLTGVETPHSIVMIDCSDGETNLYLPHRNVARSGTDGHFITADDPDWVADLTGVDVVAGPERLSEHLARMSYRGSVQTIYTPFAPAEGPSASRDGEMRVVGDRAGDPWDGRPSREGHFVELLNTRFPVFEVRNLSPILDELRIIKSPAEIRLIDRATRLSGEALMEAMRSTRPGVVEHEIDGAARFIFFRNGAQGEGYAAIVATGQNAWYPHHRAAEGVFEDGDLVLMDYAPDIEYYRTDVTRQWPVNGKFNSWQRELYGFYLACYKAILERIGPGKLPADIINDAAEAMKGILAGSTFSKPHHRAAAEEFVASYASRSLGYGALGHGVGMSTHDPGDYSQVLKPGMVFTIEPALRVPEEKLYIRLEDLIVVTETGIDVLSDFVPMEMDDVEATIAEDGILQLYGRSPWQ
ncbi:MAG TPA: Xaa-Pro peptidase family protein [Rhodothermales bacterium]|nr:Xaa-Pro peptidase family protein [Rhodothermales bacterium]